MSYGWSVLVHMASGTSVRQLPGDLPVASRLKGPRVDLLVVPGVDISRVADGLRVGLSLLRQQWDLLFREAELVQRRNIEVLGQLIDILDRQLGRFPDGFVGDVEAERLRDAGKALRLT